jgi:DNA-binding PadR family transcriptional regulator
MELSPTAFVILGMLAWRPMSGYDIKSIVDNATRFF